ncbi:MAG: hypothetical protein ACXIUM_14135 [Wenzhouxiangella sp.]
MIDNSPFWKRPGWIIILLAVAIGVGVWLAKDRPLPAGWGDGGRPTLQVPEALRRSEPDRLFCAESPETGVCRCITAAGERPEISEAECRRRARGSETQANSPHGA